MVLRPSPQGSSTMTQEPVANLNGVHPGRPSQVRFGSSNSGPVGANTSSENDKSGASTYTNGTRPQHSSRQATTKQIPERPKFTSRLTNGDHGSSEHDHGFASNTSRADSQDSWHMRHGWEDQYNSEEYLSLLSSVSNGPLAQKKSCTLWRVDYI